MKKPGDGYYPPIERYRCPFCSKKGYYHSPIPGSMLPSYRCYYCKKRGDTPEELK